MKLNVFYVEIFAVICVALNLRAIVSLHSYSGEKKPPLFGDYEAQRHWQEIVVNLSPDEWYKNSTKNNLMYWGLDYPPLTAYHSYVNGQIAMTINESYVGLDISRGLESVSHKSFMRLTVVTADVLIYIPGLLALGATLKTFLFVKTLPFFILAFMYPGQILIDNGHFQYNNISLGLAAVAISLILRNRHYLATLFFILALNYKQMELYHALPFFVYLLRICFSQKSFMTKAYKLAKISCVALLTFVILWLPWIHSPDAIESVVRRIFPIGRGVFEDKVANIWCAINVIYKLREKLTNQKLVCLCLSTTVSAVLPHNIHLYFVHTKYTFLLSLTNSAMAFFLFSFQVHEKSILLVALPALCLFPHKPYEIFWFLEVTIFSMFPLLTKDNLILPFFSMFLIYYVIIKIIYLRNFCINPKSSFVFFVSFSELAMSLLALFSVIGPVPQSYPFLWPLFIALFSCTHFLLFFCFNNFLQLVKQH